MTNDCRFLSIGFPETLACGNTKLHSDFDGTNHVQVDVGQVAAPAPCRHLRRKYFPTPGDSAPPPPLESVYRVRFYHCGSDGTNHVRSSIGDVDATCRKFLLKHCTIPGETVPLFPHGPVHTPIPLLLPLWSQRQFPGPSF